MTSSQPMRFFAGLCRLLGLSNLLDFLPKTQVQLTAQDEALIRKFNSKKNKFDKDVLKLNIDNLQNAQQEEESRLVKIEEKANSLLGFIGIASTIILGLAAASVDLKNIPSVILQICIGIFLIISIFFAIQATQVGRYKFVRLNIDNLWDLKSIDDKEVWHQQALEMLYAYLKNYHLINEKAGLVIGAQIWLRNAIIVLLFLPLTTWFGTTSSTTLPSTPTSLPPAIIIITLTPIQSTETPTVTLTATTAITLTSTETPTRFLTSTLMPTVTPTSTP